MLILGTVKYILRILNRQLHGHFEAVFVVYFANNYGKFCPSPTYVIHTYTHLVLSILSAKTAKLPILFIHNHCKIGPRTVADSGENAQNKGEQLVIVSSLVF